VLGGCVQDMVILFCSTRRDGRSLGQMATRRTGGRWRLAALIGSLMIMVILIAVLGLVIVNAMKHSPWATATVFGDDSDCHAGGLYMRLRPGKVLEGSLIGVALLLSAVIGGGWIDQLPAVRGYVRLGVVLIWPGRDHLRLSRRCCRCGCCWRRAITSPPSSSSERRVHAGRLRSSFSPPTSRCRP
jgi:carbon starvation protein CstA